MLEFIQKIYKNEGFLMISDFPNRFIDIVNQIEKNIPNEFEKKRMVNYDGNIAALSASFTINNEKKMAWYNANWQKYPLP